MTKPVLYYVPIEPLFERYTESWYRNFPVAFSKHFQVEVIDGVALTDHIQVGAFLDMNSTVAYKMSQLQKIAALFHAKKVEPGSVFYFGDIEFWGIESVRLMADMNRVPIHLAGFLHAGSYTIEDAFAIAETYQQFTEVGWVAALDEVHVGSSYHKQAFDTRRLRPVTSVDLHTRGMVHKIQVTGNPVFKSDYAEVTKPRDVRKVVLPNRFDREKRPHATLDVVELVKANSAYSDVKFVITTSAKSLRSNSQDAIDRARDLADKGLLEIKEGLTKAQYHEELATSQAMLSMSIEENFGYCIAECLHYGTRVVCWNDLSHTDFGDSEGMHYFDCHPDQGSPAIQAASLALARALTIPCPTACLPSRYYSAADTIADRMFDLHNSTTRGITQ